MGCYEVDVLGEPPKKIPKIAKTIELQDLTVPIADSRNLAGHEVASKRHLVDIQRVIQESLGVVEDEMKEEPDGCGFFRRNPLVLARLSRGGKTTVLTTLFNELKKQGYLVIIISFNGQSGFVPPRFDDHPEEIILRHIVTQFIDYTAFTKHDLETFECSEETFDAYLTQQSNYGSSSQQRVVPLIDELNVLGVPLPWRLLKCCKSCSCKKNRYLIFSNRFSFNALFHFCRKKPHSTHNKNGRRGALKCIFDLSFYSDCCCLN